MSIAQQNLGPQEQLATPSSGERQTSQLYAVQNSISSAQGHVYLDIDRGSFYIDTMLIAMPPQTG